MAKESAKLQKTYTAAGLDPPRLCKTGLWGLACYERSSSFGQRSAACYGGAPTMWSSRLMAPLRVTSRTMPPPRLPVVVFGLGVVLRITKMQGIQCAFCGAKLSKSFEP
eukprot:3669738-Amphidinium_carterae.1